MNRDLCYRVGEAKTTPYWFYVKGVLFPDPAQYTAYDIQWTGQVSKVREFKDLPEGYQKQILLAEKTSKVASDRGIDPKDYSRLDSDKLIDIVRVAAMELPKASGADEAEIDFAPVEKRSA